MIEVPDTFSDSWYRVAEQRIALRPQVEAQRQWYRGEKWIVLQDPFNATFFRLRPEAYDFIARLRSNRTVGEVWEGCMARNSDDAPGQQEVVTLLGQLYQANLLHYSTPTDSASLFERYKKRREREVRQSMLQVMFARIPLIDPDVFLRRFMPIAKLAFGPVGMILWLGVVALGAKVCIENFGALSDQTEGVLAPSNWVLLYAAMIILKVIHEFGHAFACRKYGGEVHVMGVMLLVFTPIPYVDASAAWAFRSRWQRWLVGAAGMIVEIFVAAIAAIIWANTGPGTLHGLCYNMMIIASISTILFNINPLLRFDGYYMLSDWLDIPNLHGQSKSHLVHLVERFAFGVKRTSSPASNWREAMIFTVFGILSQIYRIIVFGGILLFIADKFLIAGLVLAVVCVVSWVIVPCWKFCAYLGSSPKLERTRKRAVCASAVVATAVVLGIGVVPFPYAFRAPGVIEAKSYAVVSNDTAGTLVEVVAETGSQVAAGDVLARLSDPELAFERYRNEAMLKEARHLRLASLRAGAIDLEPIERQIQALQDQKAFLVEQEAGLTIRAPMDGLWVAGRLEELKGRYVTRGVGVGELIGEDGWQFVATVSQDDAKYVFESKRILEAGVRLSGQAEQAVKVGDHRVVPAEQVTLPSASLGWMGGGDVAVDANSSDGVTASESFYKVFADLDAAESVAVRHGRTGKIRFSMAPQPLAIQLGTKVRQMLQRRYKL